MKNPWVIIGLITVVLFGGAIWYSSGATSKSNEGVVITEHIKGNPEGKVTLVEYSDFQCPACAGFYSVAKEVVETYKDDVRFEYKHFPLVNIHRNAVAAAVAAEAAGQQGKFFEFHDMLFDNQESWSNLANPSVVFIQYAEELGLDIETFKRHLSSSVLKDKVMADFSEGRELGVAATPSFYLNGEFLDPKEFKTYQGFIERVAGAVDPSLVSTSTPSAESGVKFGL